MNFETGNKLQYVGLTIETSKGIPMVHQQQHIDRLRLLPRMSTFKEYVSARNQLAYMYPTQPDVCCAISFAVRITEKIFDEKAIIAHNSVVKYLRRSKNVSLYFPLLDCQSLRLLAYVDAGHCNR